MTRINRVFKFGFVGITISAVGTLIAGCSQEDQIRALILALIMLLTGSGGEETDTSESTQISVGNPTVATDSGNTRPLNPGNLFLILDNPANATGTITNIGFYLDTPSSLPVDIQVFTVSQVAANDFMVTDISSPITITVAVCIIEAFCTFALPTPVAITVGDLIGVFVPTTSGGVFAVEADISQITSHHKTCNTCTPTIGATFTITGFSDSLVAFGGTGSTP